MTGSLDRLIETGLASLIDTASTGVQCVANLLAGGESNAVLPRVVVKALSQESPDFQRVPTQGVYGLHPVSVDILSMVEATSTTSSAQMEEANSAVDDVVIYNGGLPVALTSGTLKVYGSIPRGCRQERRGNRLFRTRSLLLYARLQPITSEGLLTEAGEQILTEDSIPIYTE